VLPPDVKLAPPAPLPASLEKEIRNQKSAAAAAAAAAASAVAVAAESAAAATNHERPFACHHKGCNKRYIHEYKLNLHLRKEHGSDCPADVQQPQWYDDGEDDLDESGDHQDQAKARGARRERGPISIDKKARKRKKPNQAASVDSSRRIGGPRNAPPRSAMVKPDTPMVRQNREVIKGQHPEESDTDDEEDMENENIGRKFTTVQSPSDDDEEESEDDVD
jgi:transcription factor YY